MTCINMTSWIFCYFLLICLQGGSCLDGLSLRQDNDLLFKSDNVVVWFEPFVSFQDTIKPIQYNESLLTPLLLKVSSQFSAIMVHITEDELVAQGWQYMTARAVAKLNLIQNTSSTNITSGPALRIWISFHYLQPSPNDSPEINFHLSLLSKMAVNANAIFPGSVYAITIHVNTKVQTDGKVLLARYKNLLTIMNQDRANVLTQESYLIGLMYDIETCHYTCFFRTQLMKLARDYADVLFFDALTSSWHLSLVKNISEAIYWFKDEAKQCSQALESVTSKRSLTHVGMLGGIPDTTRNGDVNFSRLLTFWSSLASYGRETNTVIILDRAFDAPYLVQVFEATRGWWRLKENIKNENPAEYIFEDKRQLAEQEKNLNENINQTWAEMSVKFNSDHVGVWAFPFLYSDDAIYDTEQYKLFFSKISENFQKVLVGPVLLGENTLLNETLGRISTIAANLNTMLSKQLEVIFVLDIPVDYNDFKFTDLNLVKLNVEMANTIYENTAKLMLFNFGSDMDHSNQVLIQDIETHLTRNYTDFNYDIGMLLSLDMWCIQETSLTIPLANGSTSMSVLAITAEVSWPNLVNGVERYLRKFSIILESCGNRVKRELVNAQNQSLFDLMFILQWNRVAYEDIEIYKLARFVAFWEGLNDWATEYNTTVILGQAFDSDGHGNETKTKDGWWIPTQTNGNKQFSFEDKKSAIPRLLKEERERIKQEQSQYISNLGTMEIIWISVGVVTILSLVVMIQVYIWRKYQLYQYLSKEDVNIFFNGAVNGVESSEQNEQDSQSNMDGNYHVPYKKQVHEIKRSDFRIDNDDSAYLGDGEFGVVRKGKIFRSNGQIVHIAAKSAKHPPKKENLLGLLSEIKTLSYIGKHQSIIELMGAFTAELHKGIVLVFLEYCHLGSLKNHLHCLRQDLCLRQNFDDSHDKSFGESFDKGDRKKPIVTLDAVSSNDFSNWASEIASGMVYLASKHVVHADLAARNILLTVDKKAKISDFGLSRRMYNYKCYVKAGEEPLPWRWMAPESLRFSKFTEKSDVWSFGVLLWEIYSLGETPYPGMFWDTDFANRLENGLKLSEPSFNDKCMYSVMLECWHINPLCRFAFIDVQALLDLYKDCVE